MACLRRAGILAVCLFAVCPLAAQAEEALGPRDRLFGGHRGTYNDDIAKWRMALRRHPHDPDAHFWLGCHYARVSEFDKAVQHLEQARQLRPDHEKTHAELASAYTELARLARDRGQAQEADASLAKAESAAKALLQLPPSREESYEALIDLARHKAERFRKAGQPDKERETHDETLGYCEKALELDPNGISTHLERIRTLFALGRYQDTERRCNEVLKLNPRLYEPKFTIVRIRRMEGDCAAAIRILSGILEEKPTQIEALLRRAEIRLDLHSYEQALADADEAIRLTTRNPYANFIRGRVYMQTNGLDQAIPELQLAAAGMSKHVPSRFWLARCLWMKDQPLEATEELIALLELDPRLITARRALASVAPQNWDPDRAEVRRALDDLRRQKARRPEK